MPAAEFIPRGHQQFLHKDRLLKPAPARPRVPSTHQRADLEDLEMCWEVERQDTRSLHRSFPRAIRSSQEASSGPICWVSHKIALGVGIDYPKPNDWRGSTGERNRGHCALWLSQLSSSISARRSLSMSYRRMGQVCRRRDRPRSQCDDGLPAQAHGSSPARNPS